MNEPDDIEAAAVTLGTIGDTRVQLVAAGPKAQWCADVLSAKFEAIFLAVKSQVDEHD